MDQTDNKLTEDRRNEIEAAWNGLKGKDCNIQYRTGTRAKWKSYRRSGNSPKWNWSSGTEYRVNPDFSEKADPEIARRKEVESQWNGRKGGNCNIERNNSLTDGWQPFSGVGHPNWNWDHCDYRVIQEDELPKDGKEQVSRGIEVDQEAYYKLGRFAAREKIEPGKYPYQTKSVREVQESITSVSEMAKVRPEELTKPKEKIMKKIVNTITRNGSVLIQYSDFSQQEIMPNGAINEFDAGLDMDFGPFYRTIAGFETTRKQKIGNLAKKSGIFCLKWGLWTPLNYLVLTPAWNTAKFCTTKARYVAFLGAIGSSIFYAIDPEMATKMAKIAYETVKSIV